MITEDIANLFEELAKEHTHKEIARHFGRERKFVISMKCGCNFQLNDSFIAGLNHYGYELKLVKKENESMARYDKDIEENPYLNEHGKYAAQFARNHNIPISEAYEHPTVKAHKEAWNHLMECMDFHNGTMAARQMGEREHEK